MARKIVRQKQGALARAKLLNEVIRSLNPLLNISVEFLEPDQISEVLYSDNNVVIRVPRDASGGGLPPGFEEEELDVVEDDNTPGTRIFLTKESSE